MADKKKGGSKVTKIPPSRSGGTGSTGLKDSTRSSDRLSEDKSDRGSSKSSDGSSKKKG